MSDKGLDPALRERLATLSTNSIAGLLIQMAGMRSRAIAGVRPINPRHCRFIGPAYTVRCVPIREDMTTSGSMANPGNPHYGTYDAIPAGSVVVYDMMGNTRCGAFGDVLAAVLKARGVAGIVADGGVRDGEAIAGLEMPVFCAAIAPAPIGQGLFTAGVQEMIGCGGVMVAPGDIVVGDADGVVVIPRHLAEDVAEKGEDKEAVEAWVRTRIERGEPARGLYPPTDKIVAEFRRWRDRSRKRKPSASVASRRKSKP